MYKQNDPGLILDDAILSETHIPHIISARNTHVNELSTCLAPVFSGRKPRSVWLYGCPGTGKTTIASHMLRELNREKGIPGVYVNCWKHNTFYAVLEYILGELRRGFGDARDKRVKLVQFERLVKDRPFIIILDEIDVVPLKERNTMIYNLSNVGNVGLILISESRYPILALEDRVRSRLNPYTLEFRPYTVDELVEILTQRAAGALHPRAWDKRTLELVAEIAGGDARVAIQTLRNAASYAQSEGCERIMPEHIEKGYNDTGGLRRTYELKRLTEHHRLLYSIIEENPGISSPELYQAYLQRCEANNWKPVASRTYSLYMKRMTELKLVKAERARVKGRVHAFRVWE